MTAFSAGQKNALCLMSEHTREAGGGREEAERPRRSEHRDRM